MPWSSIAENSGGSAVAVLRQGLGHARRGATTGAGSDVQTTAELPQLQFCVKSVVIPRCSSWTRLCSCAQPVETPQAQFFSFWGPVHRYRAGGPVMRTGAGWRRRLGVVSRGVWHPPINCMRAASWRNIASLQHRQNHHHHHHTTPHHTTHTHHTHHTHHAHHTPPPHHHTPTKHTHTNRQTETNTNNTNNTHNTHKHTQNTHKHKQHKQHKQHTTHNIPIASQLGRTWQVVHPSPNPDRLNDRVTRSQ